MRELRLERARGLLIMGSARVSEIAEQCGFSSLFSFSRAFKQRYGEPPIAYRQTSRQGTAALGHASRTAG